MHDLFKRLHEKQELPEDLEKEIMQSFDTLKLFADVIDLFTHKFGRSEIEMHIEMDEAMRLPSKNDDDTKDEDLDEDPDEESGGKSDDDSEKNKD